MEYNRAQLKRAAKADLRNAHPSARLVTLVFILLTAGVSLLVSLLTFPLWQQVEHMAYALSLWADDPYQSYGIASTIGSFGTLPVISLFLNILITLYTHVMNIGYITYALSLARREETGYHALFHGFSIVGRIILFYILLALFITLWSVAIFVVAGVIGGILSAIFLLFSPVLSGIAFTLTMIVAFGFYLYIILGYEMAPYLFLDDPNHAPLAALRNSGFLMRGQRLRLIMLGLSFIGWFLLLGLIATVVFAIGLALTVVITGVSIIAFFPAAESITNFTWGLMLSGLLASLATIPLDCWLTPYCQCSIARFYDTIKAGSAQYTDTL